MASDPTQLAALVEHGVRPGGRGSAPGDNNAGQGECGGGEAG